MAAARARRRLSRTQAGPAVVAERARYYGVVPGYVLTIDVEGLEAISHAGGAHGADGYSAVLSDASTGDAVMLSAVPGDLSAATCPDLPVLTMNGSVGDGPVEVVRVSGTGVGPELLRAALESVRVPTAGELDLLLPPGDGAPDNSVGVGGWPAGRAVRPADLQPGTDPRSDGHVRALGSSPTDEPERTRA
ncbi:hypothetical protein [Isoptericola sp. G70]|uniref:hypothetical protein n=1 Tax=Isoptericola sp. G70 TaxID=3376633 RepID=UPI003A7FF6E3